MRKSKIVGGIWIMVLCFGSGRGLKCLVCDPSSEEDHICSGASDMGTLTTCSEEEKSCECKIVTSTDDITGQTKKEYQRSCSETEVSNDFCVRFDDEGEKGFGCQCNEDGCNTCDSETQLEPKAISCNACDKTDSDATCSSIDSAGSSIPCDPKKTNSCRLRYLKNGEAVTEVKRHCSEFIVNNQACVRRGQEIRCFCMSPNCNDGQMNLFEGSSGKCPSKDRKP